MRKKDLLTAYLNVLHDLHPCKACLVAGSGHGDYVEILKTLEIKDAVDYDWKPKITK